MNFELSEDLIMVRDSVAKLGQNILSHRAETNDQSETSFEMGPLKELGLDSLTWDEDDRLTTLVALLELSRWDVTSGLACLNSILGSLLGGSGLGFLGKDRRDPSQRNGSTWAGVTSFFEGADFAYGEEVFWKILKSEPAPQDLGTLGLRGAQPRLAVSDLGPIGAHPNAKSLLDSGFAALFSGVARAALIAGHAYSRERVQFGKRIADFQGTQFKLAEMASRVEATELLVLNSASDSSCAGLALALAKETCLYVTDEAVQLHGGYGYTREYEVERHFRDARFMVALLPE